MAKQQSTVIAPKRADGGPLALSSQVPDFMKPHGVEGTEVLKQYVTPPRVKVCQPLSKPPLIDRFRPGEVAVVPLLERLSLQDFDDRTANEDQPVAFYFAPIFFYPEWCAWNPIELKGTAPAILERSLDPRSALAKKTRDPETRQEKKLDEQGNPMTKDGRPMYVKNLEHLIYVVQIVGEHPLAGFVCSMTWASGEHKYGANFNALVGQRKAPLYGCQFAAVVRRRANEKGWWYGIDVENPPEGGAVTPFVMDPEQFELRKAAHLEYRGIYEAKLLRVDHEDDLGEAGTAADNKDF